jgi:hypothetical protein
MHIFIQDNFKMDRNQSYSLGKIWKIIIDETKNQLDMYEIKFEEILENEVKKRKFTWREDLSRKKGKNRMFGDDLFIKLADDSGDLRGNNQNEFSPTNEREKVKKKHFSTE